MLEVVGSLKPPCLLGWMWEGRQRLGVGHRGRREAQAGAGRGAGAGQGWCRGTWGAVQASRPRLVSSGQKWLPCGPSLGGRTEVTEVRVPSTEALGAVWLPGKAVSTKPAFSGQPVGQPLAAFFWEKARGRGLSLPGVRSGPSPARGGSPRSHLQALWFPLTSRPRESAGPSCRPPPTCAPVSAPLIQGSGQLSL